MGADRRYRGSRGKGQGMQFKALYGNRGGKNMHAMDNSNKSGIQEPFDQNDNGTSIALRQLLSTMDGKSYGQYKQLTGKTFNYSTFKLLFDRIQSDPYAPPSKIRIRVSQNIAKFPSNLYDKKIREIALSHYITKIIHQNIVELKQPLRGGNKGWRSAKGGALIIDCPGQEILQRTSVVVNGEFVEARINVSLPASGRTILGGAAINVLTRILPKVVEKSMLYQSLEAEDICEIVSVAEDQEYLREHLSERGLVAFVANGSILPRHSGISNLPMASSSNPVAFKSPASMQTTFTLPNRGQVTGMGIPNGVTLITGGGFHGKSTLLQAIELGVYNHEPRDGREYIVSNISTAKIKAEEGRYVGCTDISPFINNLPFGKDTRQFTTEDASGSTSMAASIQEALEAGSKLLIFDEDSCATNFLIRDRRMQLLVDKKDEPITPLVSRIRELWTEHSVSSILVIGGCGDYLEVADTVISMKEYQALDFTDRAKQIVSSCIESTGNNEAESACTSSSNIEKTQSPYGGICDRVVYIPSELVSYKKPKAMTRHRIDLFPNIGQRMRVQRGVSDMYDEQESCNTSTDGENVSSNAHSQQQIQGLVDESKEKWIATILDVSELDQIADESQTRAIADIISYIADGSRGSGQTKKIENSNTSEKVVQNKGNYREGVRTVSEWLNKIDSTPLDDIVSTCTNGLLIGDRARPRRIEVAMAINRLRYAIFSANTLQK